MMTRAEIAVVVGGIGGAKYRLPREGEPPNNEPGEFHCQGLVKYVSKVCFDREIFLIDTPGARVVDLIRFIRDHPERYMWRVQEGPEHGGLVEMSYERHPHHVGIWLDIDGGGILHAYHAGVAFATVLELRAAGWRRFVFHGWNGSRLQAG